MSFFDDVMEFAKPIADVVGTSTTGVPWGSVLSAGATYFGQQGTNNTNMDIAQNQMRFQREMSNTSYQRAVKDMQAAGLSPMLAYSQGGASTPSGAAIPVQNKLGAAVDAFQKQQATNSAVDLQRAQTGQSVSQTELNTAQAARAKSEQANIEADTINKIAQNPALQKTVEKMAAEIESLKAQSKLSTAKTNESYQEQNIKKPKEAFSTENPTAAKWKDPVLESLKVIIDGVNPFSRLIPNTTRIVK